MSSILDPEDAAQWLRDVVPALIVDLQDFDAHDVEVLAHGSIRDQQQSICRTDRLTLETAAEAYAAESGHPPSNQQDLVDAGLLYGPSANYDVAADGTVILAPDPTATEPAPGQERW
jgi:hypothetical protein